ncbi:Alanine racemase, biosynthetic [Hartmannibacter diazotrophicus]|uniref:Alanine racemase n=1 Tax=Hartmannibacter diazotrophicus TaxID=1482074 RepID=A0A2C9D6H9_9HYPH|nr:alanine racemase [Hartmannibacter diazotrophicus]SON55351.1 Alanine racemase, biosynthetic [Hartmannibacter diazotrophicus]
MIEDRPLAAPDLQPETAGARLSIDLAALVHNWRDLGGRARQARCAAVVKADGYGLGIEPVARALSDAGCDTFFAALPAEGARVRRTVPDATIYILNGLFDGCAPFLAAHNLRPVLGSMPEIEEWLAFGRIAGDVPSPAIHVDTGMNRLGLSLSEAQMLASDAARMDALSPSLVMSHFACADTPQHPLNTAQLADFADVRRMFPGLPGSLANSAGVFLGNEAHHDLMRPGIALYGAAAVVGALNPMRTVVTLEARVIQVRDVLPGQSVGYGAAWLCETPTRIAVISVGYADGFLRAAGSHTGKTGSSAAIEGHLAPIVGRVSMDLIAIDVTALPDGLVQRGSFVELFGPNIPIDRAAARAGTIGYEFLTGLGPRYLRRYV